MSVEQVRIGDVIIQKAPFVDGTILLTAWEPSRIGGKHSTITFFRNENGNGNKCYGRIGTNPPKSRYEHLRGGSPSRIQAVEDAYLEVHMRALALIRQAFPASAASGKELLYGEILVSLPIERNPR